MNILILLALAFVQFIRDVVYSGRGSTLYHSRRKAITAAKNYANDRGLKYVGLRYG